MPQATQELRDYWNGVNDAPAINHLTEAGYKLHDDWTWQPPAGITLETMPERDFLAIMFLQQEWDFGGLRQ